MRKLMSIMPALLIAACGSQVVVFPEDASIADSSKADVRDAGRDVGRDSPVMETSKEAMPETSMEATMEATIETGMETSMEAAIESGLDAPMEVGVCIPGTVLPVVLGTASGFAILTESGISTVPPSAITGDIGVSPITATAITGFSLTPCTGTCPSSTSTQVVGNVYAANYGPPTPIDLGVSIGDMQIAYTDAAGRAPGITELGAGSIGGLTLAPGVYKWSSGLLIATNITLQGSCGDVWIFEVADGLTVSSGAKVLLSGGAQAKNIFWQVAGGLSGVSVALGTTSHVEGTVMALDAITLATGASVNGRLLSQKATTLEQNTVSIP